MASMKLSLFTWKLIFLRDHFFNDTDTESGLVFWKWTIPRPSPVSSLLSERYRYRVWSRFLKVNDTETESGLDFLEWTIPSPFSFF